MRFITIGLASCVMVGCTSVTSFFGLSFDADEPWNKKPARLTLSHENDLYSGEDRDYTNGARVDYVFAPTKDPKGVAQVISKFTQVKGDDVEYRTGIAAGQEIYTPEDFDQPTQPEGQHPYAGYLYGDYSVYASNETTLDKAGIQFGIIGPSSYAEEIQDLVHDIVGREDAQGWSEQLNDEPGIKFSYERLQKIPVNLGRLNDSTQGAGAKSSLAADFVHQYGIDLGNVATQALLGTTFRFGTGLENDFGPGGIHPSTGALGVSEAHTPWSLYGFVGVTGRAVAQNIFLDGNKFKESFSVEKEPFVLDTRAGIVLQQGSVRATASFVLQGKEYETQKAPHGIGSFSLSFGL